MPPNELIHQWNENVVGDPRWAELPVEQKAQKRQAFFRVLEADPEYQALAQSDSKSAAEFKVGFLNKEIPAEPPSPQQILEDIGVQEKGEARQFLEFLSQRGPQRGAVEQPVSEVSGIRGSVAQPEVQVEIAKTAGVTALKALDVPLVTFNAFLIRRPREAVQTIQAHLKARSLAEQDVIVNDLLGTTDSGLGRQMWRRIVLDPTILPGVVVGTAKLAKLPIALVANLGKRAGKAPAAAVKPAARRISEETAQAVERQAAEAIKGTPSAIELKEPAAVRARELLEQGVSPGQVEAAVEAVPRRTIPGAADETSKAVLATTQDPGLAKQAWVATTLDDVRAARITPLEQTIRQVPEEVGGALATTQVLKNLQNGAIDAARHAGEAITPMNVVFDIADGAKGTYDGPIFRTFKAKTDVQWAKYAQESDVLKQRASTKAVELGLGEEGLQRVGAWAALAQENGLQKMLNAGYTEKQLQTFLAKGLSPNETKYYNFLRTKLDELRPRIAGTLRQVFNQELGFEPNYFPFLTDWDEMVNTPLTERLGFELTPEGRVGFKPQVEFTARTKKPPMGFTMERTGAGRQIPKINALQVFSEHVDNALYFTHMAEHLDRLGALVRNPEYGKLVGSQALVQHADYVDTLARKGGVQGGRSRLLDSLRRNVGSATLLLKMSTLSIQPTALLGAVGEIGRDAFHGAQDIAISLSKRMTGKQGLKEIPLQDDWFQFTLDHMPEVRRRVGDDPIYQEIISGKKFVGGPARVGAKLLQGADGLTAQAVAAGAYRRSLRERGLPINLLKPDVQGVQDAQQVVQKTQASHQFKDMPQAFSRGKLTGLKSVDNMVLQFQSFVTQAWWARFRHDALRAGMNTKNWKRSANLAFWLLGQTVVETGVRNAVRGGTALAGAAIAGKATLSKRDEDYLKELAQQMIFNVPYVSTLAGMTIYDGEFFPAGQPLKKAATGLQKLGGERPATKLRGVLDIAEAAAVAGGVPGAAQAGQLGREVIRQANP